LASILAKPRSQGPSCCALSFQSVSFSISSTSNTTRKLIYPPPYQAVEKLPTLPLLR